MSIKVYKKENIIFAKHIAIDHFNEGLSFYSEDTDAVQVGTWNYNKGKELLAHNHNIVERKVNRTQEVIIIKSGKLYVQIYDEEDNIFDNFEANAGDILIMLNGGHGYEVLEDNTQVIEIKNGPYPGAKMDRRRL